MSCGSNITAHFYLKSIPMLSTKNLILSADEVSNAWMFEYYAKLNVNLSGQTLMIKSIFNSNDTNPSLCIYPDTKKINNQYRFKDFSTGDGGDGYNFVQRLFKITPKEALLKVMKEYSEFLKLYPDGYKPEDFKEQAKYKVSGVEKRSWNTLDKEYWLKYGIGSIMLKRYNVCPLESYLMTKESENSFIIKSQYIYGYFRENGDLYKIYQPKLTSKKFMKILSYTQGADQLKLQKPYLVICSSLKDMMCLEGFGYNLETLAPDSENTLIQPNAIASYRHNYKSICVLFDNDIAGVSAMKKYYEKYSLPGVHLKLDKDLSDSVATHGKEKVSELLYPLLKEALTKHVNKAWQKQI